MEEFLIEKLGEAEGRRLAKLANERFEELSAKAPKKSRSQEKVFRNMLLPRVALYKVLLEDGMDKEKAQLLMHDYMVVTAQKMRKNYEMMDSLPCGWFLFSKGFTKIVAKSDLWDADIEKGKDWFNVTMKRCFWHDTYREYGCEEICRYACECDDITYSDLTKIRFDRTQTLGTGGTCCDFRFEKRRK